MKSLNLKLTLSQYLSLKNINQKDFLTGKSQSELENIARLLGVSLDLKPLEKKPEAVAPVKIDLPPSKETIKAMIEQVESKEDLVVENKNSSEEVTGHVSKLLQFVKEVAENSESNEYSKEYLDSSSKKRRRS